MQRRTVLSYGLISLGLVLLLGSVGQVWWQDIWYWWHQRSSTVYSLEASASAQPNVKQITPKSRDFGLVIEKIGVNEEVAPDVDPFKPSEYLPVLQKFGVAEAKHGAAPGTAGTTYLFGHSTVNLWEIGRYHAPFTLLDKLAVGDRIVVFFQQQRYDYVIRDMKRVKPTEVHYLTDARESPTLILQTCDPPGENTERLLVIAEMEAPPGSE